MIILYESSRHNIIIPLIFWKYRKKKLENIQNAAHVKEQNFDLSFLNINDFKNSEK